MNWYLKPLQNINDSETRVNLATGFASLAMTVYLWIQLAQVVVPPMV